MTTPHPTDDDRTANASARTPDAERPEYSVDQIGDDQTPVASEVATDGPLVPATEAVDFKARWDVVQQGFVDDPRTAVTDADKLVGDVLDRLSKTFDEQHRTLEGQWSNGEPSTEDLRSALQRYRAFFQRLLAI
jgi:hypothetical protein